MKDISEKNSSIMPETIRKVGKFISEHDLFARRLGIELIEIQEGYSRVSLTLKPDMVNGLGMPHGGVIFSVADFAFAAACNSYGKSAVALSMDVHFLSSPDPGDQLTAEAKEVRRGKRTALYQISVRDQSQNLVAELHGMAYQTGKPFLEEN